MKEMNKRYTSIITTLSFATAIMFSFGFTTLSKVKNTNSNKLENTVWVTDKILGLNLVIDKYELKKYDSNKFTVITTSFKDKNRFISKYTAPCGFNYLNIVYGKYEVFDKNKLKINIDSVVYTGEWKKPTEHRKNNELIFKITTNKSKLILTKLSNK